METRIRISVDEKKETFSKSVDLETSSEQIHTILLI